MSTTLWAVYCRDEPDAAERRRAAREAHSTRLRSAALRPVLYGPLVADDQKTPIGSFILFEAETREHVERFIAEDPFTINQVWQTVHIDAFVPSRNSPYPWPSDGQKADK